MKQTMRIGLLCAAALLLLTGCGSQFSADQDTVYIGKKGTVKGANVAEFEKDYYDETELSDFITETVDTYVARAGAGSVEIAEFAVEDGVAHVYLNYASVEDYADFNGVEFYAGTVLDARADGYELPEDFTAVTEDETAWDAQGNKIVIIGQQTTVQVDGTILYVSQNAEATGKNTASVTYDILDEDAAPAYIIYK